MFQIDSADFDNFDICNGLYPVSDDFMTAAIIMKGERK